ncbi:hypothetical protein JOM56_009979 [Amanita muscaria]
MSASSIPFPQLDTSTTTMRDGALLTSSRQRTPQACDKCRERKTKCSGDRPVCKRCTARGLICTYSCREPRSRGPSRPRTRAAAAIQLPSVSLMQKATMSPMSLRGTASQQHTVYPLQYRDMSTPQRSSDVQQRVHGKSGYGYLPEPSSRCHYTSHDYSQLQSRPSSLTTHHQNVHQLQTLFDTGFGSRSIFNTNLVSSNRQPNTHIVAPQPSDMACIDHVAFDCQFQSLQGTGMLSDDDSMWGRSNGGTSSCRRFIE